MAGVPDGPPSSAERLRQDPGHLGTPPTEVVDGGVAAAQRSTGPRSQNAPRLYVGIVAAANNGIAEVPLDCFDSELMGNAACTAGEYESSQTNAVEDLALILKTSAR